MPTEQNAKQGLWEDGKRIRWFDHEEASLIKNKQLDYTQYFTMANSGSWIDLSSDSFDPPNNFNERLESLKQDINNIRG